ncbi:MULTISPECIES: LacI family DNA-binding transcriptional regulator [Pseudomonas syringae group]|uniref:LacI family DNA-binding transcriptional regulator n=3 Tax=Pseudomonas syringae group TaxID=136849 RepID=A0AAD0DUA2_9PSED|nr:MULTISPECIES: LacI family DNA-binding transcriptional regulator [Pseudomonas syringae group]AVB18181.1 LacI family DNA-binding transcriptional regulator [Pseudomonas avellanae]EGH08728.1 LacI family transcriptional regulator [Pseudomonas amygdali pv. morsprunorum str. M302280]KWS70362.1 LacI family transcriptional regulator [Pseudomonas amygdali pv. morsprunorum]PHN40350.1 LacI family transcriptional regulator [Pseudomonas avellanae]POC96965.1 LacI family transcriptional regulator [Pseudomo
MADEKPATRKRRGAGRVTITAVARQAGVSAITVSRYFNQPEQVSPELRERIAAVVNTLGYVPNLVAGGLASARSKVVAMVIPNISGPIFANTIQGFSDTLSQHGFQLLLASSYFSAEQEESAVRAFLGWSPAALVLTSRFHSPATEKMIEQTDVPVIETWDHQPDRSPIQIGFSHYDVGVTAARYLHAKGYRRIAFVQNSVAGDFSALERRDGYAATLEGLGLKPWVFVPDAGRAPFEAGKQAMETLMSQAPRPDAIVFANDNLAAGALLASQRAGLHIPQDCAVMGFGDYAFAEMMLPSLTTIKPPALEIGVMAATRVLESLGVLPVEGEIQRLNLLDCRLVEREST